MSPFKKVLDIVFRICEYVHPQGPCSHQRYFLGAKSCEKHENDAKLIATFGDLQGDYFEVHIIGFPVHMVGSVRAKEWFCERAFIFVV